LLEQLETPTESRTLVRSRAPSSKTPLEAWGSPDQAVRPRPGPRGPGPPAGRRGPFGTRHLRALGVRVWASSAAGFGTPVASGSRLEPQGSWRRNVRGSSSPGPLPAGHRPPFSRVASGLRLRWAAHRCREEGGPGGPGRRRNWGDGRHRCGQARGRVRHVFKSVLCVGRDSARSGLGSRGLFHQMRGPRSSGDTRLRLMTRPEIPNEAVCQPCDRSTRYACGVQASLEERLRIVILALQQKSANIFPSSWSPSLQRVRASPKLQKMLAPPFCFR